MAVEEEEEEEEEENEEEEGVEQGREVNMYGNRNYLSLCW